MINPNWIRWVTASCRVHFEANKGGYHLHFDGMDEDDLENQSTHAEYRIDGPSVTEFQGRQYRLDVAINILVQSKQDNVDLDKLKRIAGQFQSAFVSTINVYKFGDGPDDDRTVLLGCLVLNDRVRWNNFGVVDETLKLEQGTIEGRYRLYLDT